jgi:hypothetical protein
LLLGKGQMFRKTQEMPDLSADLEQFKQLLTHLIKLQENEAEVLQYHQILRKEISYLQDLDQLLIQNQSYLNKLPLEFEEIQKSIKSKLLNKV